MVLGDQLIMVSGKSLVGLGLQESVMIVRDVSSAPARSQTVARDMNYQGATSLAATRSKTSREDPNDARSVNNAVDNAAINAPNKAASVQRHGHSAI